MPSAGKIIVQRLLKQADWCEKLGSELYSKLLRQTAADVQALGPCWTVLRGHHDDPPGSALALRFLGGVHRLVLQGKAPQLAMYYPSTALAIKRPGTATVVYHSIVWQYLSPKERDRIARAITTAGRDATTKNPLAWLRFEPGERWADVRLRLWPDGTDRLIAQSGFHGRPVHWFGQSLSR